MEEILDALRGTELLHEPRAAAMGEVIHCAYDLGDSLALSNRIFTPQNVEPREFQRVIAKLLLGLTSAMILVGLIPLRGTVLGFGMAFGASLLVYECFLLLKLRGRRGDNLCC